MLFELRAFQMSVDIYENRGSVAEISPT